MTTSPPPEPSTPPRGGVLQNGAASVLHALAKTLGSMAARSEGSGPLVGLAQAASRRTGALGHWLQEHEPAEIPAAATGLARRRPATLAAAAALVAGLLVRSARRGRRSTS